MRALAIIKVDPRFCCLEKLAQGMIGPALSHCQLEDPDKAFGIAIVCWGTGSTHGGLKAFLLESYACLLRPILTALIRMPNGPRDAELHHVHSGDHQLGLHAVVKHQG